jgi:hypothetical protein
MSYERETPDTAMGGWLLRLLRRGSGKQAESVDAPIEETSRALLWEIGAERSAEFRALGLKQIYFFPHQLRFLQRPGSDGYRLARRMYGLNRPTGGHQLVLHAAPEACHEFPAELFFCRNLIWHQQHLGLPGHVAVADLFVDGSRLYTTARFSDLVQRIPRRRDLKTRVERVFRGWDQMLLNGIVHFAVRRRLREIWFPTAELALENTDRNRNPKPALFERLYQSHLARFHPRREGRAWVVDVREAGRMMVAPTPREEPCELGKTVCIVHDTERGFGYRALDPQFAARADLEAPHALQRMLALEARLGVNATYSVVGCFLAEVRAAIESAGHSLAFHSYDHSSKGDQLYLCRCVDYRLPGYRPPQSRLTRALADDRLAFHNFEWLASSESSFGFSAPRIENGVVKLPIRLDDHALYTRELDYNLWWERLSSVIQQHAFVAFGLHDCYAPLWLDHYPEMLARLQDSAALRRLDDIANLLVRRTAV